MKTYILRCEKFDSRTSLEDRLKWVKAGRVLLMMPEKLPPDLSRQDLVRLKRCAVDLHAQLGLVTSNEKLQAVARSAGLAVFDSSEDAHQGDWVSDQQSPLPKRSSYTTISRLKPLQTVKRVLPDWLRWLAFGLAVLSILVLLAALLPGAQVELNLPRQYQIRELTLTARQSLTQPDLIDGIPLERILAEVNAQVQQETSGRTSTGDDPATGSVIFSNLTDIPQDVPTGTIVRSLEPALRFTVKRSGSLPAGPGTTITLPVAEMDDNGPLGNLPAGTLLAVDPPLGQFLSVTNPEPFSGGTMIVSSALTGADLQAASLAIDQALVKAFQNQVAAELPVNAHLIPGSIAIQTVTSESTTPPYDRPLESFEFSRTAELSGVYYLDTDLQEWVTMALDASLPVDRNAVRESLDVEIISIQSSPDGSVRFSLHASRQTIPVFDSKAIAIQLQGLTPEVATNLIQEKVIPGSQPEIRLIPAWWLRLPLIPERISIHG